MEDTEDLLAAYKKVRDDFLDNRKSKMGSGLRIVRKNVDWFLMDQVERLTERVADRQQARELLEK